jgi:hypothetical protein
MFKNGLINHSGRIDNNNFLIAVADKLFLFNAGEKTETLLLQFSESISGIEYDSLNQNIFVVFIDKVEIYSYPQLSKIKTVVAEYQIKALKLGYGY